MTFHKNDKIKGKKQYENLNINSKIKKNTLKKKKENTSQKKKYCLNPNHQGFFSIPSIHLIENCETMVKMKNILNR